MICRQTLSKIINGVQTPIVIQVKENGQKTHVGHHYELMTVVVVELWLPSVYVEYAYL